MNKQDLKFQLKQDLARLQNSVFRVIAKFPRDKNWDNRHVRIAIKKLVENPELLTEQVIESIKKSWACHGENWMIDGGKEYIPLTQEEEDFNEKIKK